MFYTRAPCFVVGAQSEETALVGEEESGDKQLLVPPVQNCPSGAAIQAEGKQRGGLMAAGPAAVPLQGGVERWAESVGALLTPAASGDGPLAMNWGGTESGLPPGKVPRTVGTSCLCG